MLRYNALQILGFTITDVPLEVLRTAYRNLTEQATEGKTSVGTKALPLADVAAAWEQQRQGAPAKLALTP